MRCPLITRISGSSSIQRFISRKNKKTQKSIWSRGVSGCCHCHTVSLLKCRKPASQWPGPRAGKRQVAGGGDMLPPRPGIQEPRRSPSPVTGDSPGTVCAAAGSGWGAGRARPALRVSPGALAMAHQRGSQWDGSVGLGSVSSCTRTLVNSENKRPPPGKQ